MNGQHENGHCELIAQCFLISLAANRNDVSKKMQWLYRVDNTVVDSIRKTHTLTRNEKCSEEKKIQRRKKICDVDAKPFDRNAAMKSQRKFMAISPLVLFRYLLLLLSFLCCLAISIRHFNKSHTICCGASKQHASIKRSIAFEAQITCNTTFRSNVIFYDSL